jgi:glycosyltransferase involved in cell wall biosynthesis
MYNQNTSGTINVHNVKILLITNLCSHYRVGLFELLHKIFKIKFLFYSEGEEKYYNGPSLLGNFEGEYLRGFYIFPKIKINPKLISCLLFEDYTHVIKCINGPFPLLASFIISKLRGRKFILWSSLWKHPNTLFHTMTFPIVHLLYRYSDAIIVYGPHVKKYLLALGVPTDKISIAWQVQNNATYQKIADRSQTEELKQKHGIHTAHIIMFVGRLVQSKGINILLHAFHMLNNDDVSLVVIGDGTQEYLLHAFKGKSNIIHIPHVPSEELYLYYSIADIFVLPSITTAEFKEPWGFVVNEAMCQGCAIITSDAVGAGVGGLVEEGKNGFVVPEGNSHALKDALEKLLFDKPLLIAMKEHSRTIIKDWTYEKMAGGFEEAIMNCSKKNLGHGRTTKE